jgi:hypothetical protein
MSCKNELTHVGIIYTDIDNEVKYIHLINHNIFIKDNFKEQICNLNCIVEVNIESIQKLKIITNQINYFFKKHQGDDNTAIIPYGFSLDDNIVINNKNFSIDMNEYDGFTCATIILYLFRLFKYPLIDISTWSNIDKKSKLRQLNLLFRLFVIKEKYIYKMYEYQLEQILKTMHKRVSSEEIFASAYTGERNNSYYTVQSVLTNISCCDCRALS